MDAKGKIAIGFVIYNSDDTFIDRLQLCADANFHIYVFDNSPQLPNARKMCNSLDNCTYLTIGKNAGLGLGISALCAQAYYHDFAALVFFDQDTGFDNSTLDFIERFYINNAGIKKTHSAVVFNAKNYNIENSIQQYILNDILLAISSGSMFFLDVLHKMNWHNETYFVDCVDYEFCLNSSNHNYKIAECSNTPGFDHVTEQADKEYKLLGKTLRMRTYSAKRVYGTIIGSLRLFFASIRSFNWIFARAIFRSMTIYIYFQLLVRIANFYNKKDG